jgi:hypothetical protein
MRFLGLICLVLVSNLSVACSSDDEMSQKSGD